MDEGAATTKAEWGAPAIGDDYRLCVSDAGALVATLVAPAGVEWRESSSAFRHKARRSRCS